MKFIELTDEQRRKMVGDHAYSFFTSIDRKNINIITGVYDDNTGITLTMYSWASPILTRDFEEAYYVLFYEDDVYMVNKYDKLYNKTPFSDEIIKDLITYYEENYREKEQLNKNVVDRYEKEYDTNITNFKKWYIEEVIGNKE